MKEAISFDQVISSIKEKYAELGHEDGWVFLNSPKRTYSQSTQIVFLALNPRSYERGGDGVREEYREGNAYLKEWWQNGDFSPLQRQVQRFYRLLARACGDEKTWEQLMNDSLVSNVCPFSSADWKQLRERKMSSEFSEQLWKSIFAVLRPKVIVCLGRPTFWIVRGILSSQLGGPESQETNDTGWGNSKYRMATFNAGKLLLAGLPHLSRYKLFNESESRTEYFVSLFSSMSHLLK